jgi:hypothetical protein
VGRRARGSPLPLSGLLPLEDRVTPVAANIGRDVGRKDRDRPCKALYTKKSRGLSATRELSEAASSGNQDMRIDGSII